MLNVVLVRHGQTEANRDGFIQGQGDTPLTQAGINDTSIKTGKLKDFRFDAVYCSDLGRARRTLEILQDRLPSLPKAVYLKELREIDFGEYTGRRKDEIMPEILRHKADMKLKYPGGESGADLKRRVLEFFKKCLDRHENETLLVVTHYGVMETAIKEFTDHPAGLPVTIDPEAVYHLSLDGSSSAKGSL